jgi:hypothetical protein
MWAIALSRYPVIPSHDARSALEKEAVIDGEMERKLD